MISAEEVLTMYQQRRQARGPILSQMQELRNIYNAEVVLPLPEMDKAEKSMIANLVSQGLDQSAMRVASTMPGVSFLLAEVASKTAEKAAKKQKDAVMAWWHENRLKLKQRRRARWLLGYAMAPVVIKPDWEKRMPKWQLMEPLNTFPAPSQDWDELTPTDCIFSFYRSYSWVCDNYPDKALAFANGQGAPARDDKIEFLEYISREERCLVAMSKEPASWESYPLRRAIKMEWAENETGKCWAVVPGRITLDRPQGQFDGMLGMYQAQARLMALSMIATEKGIFSDTYLVSRPGERAQFISGPHDGRTGKVNIVAGGDIKDVQQNPGYQTNPMMSVLERNMRLTGGIPSEFGGESPTNVRTGRRGDAILSAIVDFPVQEAQELFQFSLQEENKVAIAIDKTYFDKPKTFYVQWKGSGSSKITYTPSDLFKNDINFVNFAHAGADINSLIVGIGQRVGIGLMSIRTGQEMDPLIEDPELEHDRTVAEGIEKALLQQLQTLAAQPGGMPITDMARIMQYVKSDRLELAEALIKVQQEAQDRQATPAAPGAPEAQPGIEMPGQGAQQGMAPIGAPPEGQKNLTQMLNEMRTARSQGSVRVPA